MKGKIKRASIHPIEDPELENDRRLVAYTLRSFAEQVETGHIDGFEIRWLLGDKVIQSEVKRFTPTQEPSKD